jgi:hypothetical protein
MKNGTMENAILEALSDSVSGSTDVLTYLSSEQAGALEMKFASLDTVIQRDMMEKFPSITSPVALYVLRQMRKEANGKLASNLRPGWITSIRLNIPALESANGASRDEAVRRLSSIAEEMPDVKEAIKCLKSVKVQLDKTSTDSSIVEACRIFGIQPSSLK